MQERSSGGPDVVALPPLILGAAIALGLSLNFFWPIKVLARAVAVPIGILTTLGAVAIGILAVREMFAASTPPMSANARPRSLPRGSFKKPEIQFISAWFCSAPGLLFSPIRSGFWFLSYRSRPFCKKA